MSRKLNNQEWEEFINKYYDSNSSKTINQFCKEHGVSKQQFHYHKKRIRERKNLEGTSLFHEVKINSEININKKSEPQSTDIKIVIGNITVNIPISETTLIAMIIKELAINVES